MLTLEPGASEKGEGKPSHIVRAPRGGTCLGSAGLRHVPSGRRDRSWGDRSAADRASGTDPEVRVQRSRPLSYEWRGAARSDNPGQVLGREVVMSPRKPAFTIIELPVAVETTA